MSREKLSKLNERITFLRERAGLNKVEFAEKVGMSGAYLTDLEAGKKTNLGPHIAKLICFEFNVNHNWLLYGEGPMEKEPREAREAPEGFIFIPQVSGEISAGAGLSPMDTVEMRIAFRTDWIKRKGDPKNMSLIKVRGDSMEPTLRAGDLVLVDHGRNGLDPEGGLYALSIDHQIIVKRIQVLFTEKKIRIVSDNPRGPTFEADPEEVDINGKVIWFARELER